MIELTKDEKELLEEIVAYELNTSVESLRELKARDIIMYTHILQSTGIRS